MRIVRGILAVACLLVTGVRAGEACSCANQPTPCQEYARSRLALVGEVLSVEEVDGLFRMRLRVLRALKGIRSPTVELWSDARSSCGVKLDVGTRYLLYPSGAAGERLGISACSGGQQLYEGEPLPELPPVAGRVYGRVTRYDMERVRRFRPLEPVASVRLWIELPGRRLSATSDRWGAFTFDVPPGTYNIGVDAGRELAPRFAPTFKLTAEGGCTTADIVLEPSGGPRAARQP